MSKNPRSETNLRKATQLLTDAEARTVTFTKTYKVHGHNKSGTFTFRYPSVMDKVRIGTERAKMLDGANEASIDAYTSNVSYMICYLDKTCVKKPGWFNLYTLEETEIVEDLFGEVTRWVEGFRKDIESGKYNGASFTGDDEDDMGGGEAF